MAQHWMWPTPLLLNWIPMLPSIQLPHQSIQVVQLSSLLPCRCMLTPTRRFFCKRQWQKSPIQEIPPTLWRWELCSTEEVRSRTWLSEWRTALPSLLIVSSTCQSLPLVPRREDPNSVEVVHLIVQTKLGGCQELLRCVKDWVRNCTSLRYAKKKYWE